MTAPGPYYGTHTQPIFQPPPPPPPQFVYNPYDQPLIGAGGQPYSPSQYYNTPPGPTTGGQYYGAGGGQYFPVPGGGAPGGYQTGQQDNMQKKIGCCESFMQSVMCCCAGMFCFMCLASMCDDSPGLCMDQQGFGGDMDSFVNDDD